MKNAIYYLLFFALTFSACKTSNKPVGVSGNETVHTQEGDTLRIANEETEYEIMIIEPGFNNWMRARVKPRGYYTQEFLESRNNVYVVEWNNRVLNPQAYNPNLYEMTINYERHIDYGYEVNYLLYYYFIYFQRTYDQRLGGWVPRI